MSLAYEKQQTIESMLAALPHELLLTADEIKIGVRTATENLLSMLAKAPQFEFRSVSAFVSLSGHQVNGRVEIDPHSIEVTSADISHEDRLRITTQVQEKLLEVSKFPMIVLEISDLSTSFGHETALLKGTLTLHGVSRRVAMPLRITGRSGLSGRLTLSQREFGIEPLSAFAGMLKSKDELEVTIDISLSALGTI